MDMELIVFDLITYSSDARSACTEALMYARKGDFDKAQFCLQNAAEELSKAHKLETQLLQKEAQGKKIEVSFLIVHAQDHLMNAVTIKDLTGEMVKMYKEMKSLKA